MTNKEILHAKHGHTHTHSYMCTHTYACYVCMCVYIHIHHTHTISIVCLVQHLVSIQSVRHLHESLVEVGRTQSRTQSKEERRARKNKSKKSKIHAKDNHQPPTTKN
eukprot:m.139471 g.139471  ORF g.139471 m.139471 type:complete len:107 (+) comp30058_c0_seq1:3054-3374(+)